MDPGSRAGMTKTSSQLSAFSGQRSAEDDWRGTRLPSAQADCAPRNDRSFILDPSSLECENLGGHPEASGNNLSQGMTEE